MMKEKVLPPILQMTRDEKQRMHIAQVENAAPGYPKLEKIRVGISKEWAAGCATTLIGTNGYVTPHVELIVADRGGYI